MRYEKLLALHALGDDLVATKELLYKAQVVKKSYMLPPDENSLMYDILREDHQAYTGGVALTALSHHFLSINIAGKYTAT